jgi:hypothetical protein
VSAFEVLLTIEPGLFLITGLNKLLLQSGRDRAVNHPMLRPGRAKYASASLSLSFGGSSSRPSPLTRESKQSCLCIREMSAKTFKQIGFECLRYSLSALTLLICVRIGSRFKRLLIILNETLVQNIKMTPELIRQSQSGSCRIIEQW